jgi:hypothetical protein
METQFLSKPKIFSSFLSEKSCWESAALGTIRHTATCTQTVPCCPAWMYEGILPLPYVKQGPVQTYSALIRDRQWLKPIYRCKYAYKECLCRASLCRVEWENMYRTEALQVSYDIYSYSNSFFSRSIFTISFFHNFSVEYIGSEERKKKKRDRGS